MGVLSNMIGRADLKPGDHIYSWRSAYIYAHHGIYVGEGQVIHFTRGAGQELTGTILDRLVFSSAPLYSSANPCPNCGDQSILDGVISSCIDCFLSGGDLYIHQYNVSHAFFLAKTRGTCSLVPSDPSEEVLHRASFLLQNGFAVYHIFRNNCEDFAIYCKTGLLGATSIGVGLSGQAAPLFAAASAVVSSPLMFLSTTLGGLTGVGVYCVSMLVFGVRRDMVKVSLESLAADPGSIVSQVATVVAKED